MWVRRLDEICREFWFWALVYGREICIVIKGKGLRGEQFISLSKQRGKNWALVAGKLGRGEGRKRPDWAGEFMVHVGVDLVLCQWT